MCATLPWADMQAKHLFPPSAALAIWNLLEADLSQPLAVTCYHALLLLLSFFPHRLVNTEHSLPWKQWSRRAVQMWGKMQHQMTWTRLWLAFLSRLAKWDRYVRLLVW
jgi:hypothetical protein